jgi:hypothetical protein
VKGQDPVTRGGGERKLGEEKAVVFSILRGEGVPKICRIKLLHRVSLMISRQKKDLIRMLRFKSEQIMDVLFGAVPPIHIVPQKNDSIRFLKVPGNDPLRGIQISMGIPYKNDLPLGGEMDEPRFPFKYLTHLIEKLFEIHFYNLSENKSLFFKGYG